MENLKASYLVLVNAEEQYCLWPANVDVPKGWERVGEASTKEVCLARIEEAWIDMRPKSLRQKDMEHQS